MRREWERRVKGKRNIALDHYGNMD
jgi:hypothetical protein